MIAAEGCANSHSSDDGDTSANSGGAPSAGAPSANGGLGVATGGNRGRTVTDIGGSEQTTNTSRGASLDINAAAGAPAACASVSQSAKLRPVYLAFVFDESGSMGMLDFPWEDPVLKWNPVVAATRAFFESEASRGIFASLTLFPADKDSCDPNTYAHFDVPMTALPSTALGQVLTSIGIPVGEGTPTRPAIQGTVQQLRPMAENDPNATYALVLVTDGLPNDCSDNTVKSTAAEVRALAAIVPTYVIGVENPPMEDAPDSLSGLNAIAEAGGAGGPFIIETGDPDRTIAAFSAAIEQIRGASISCNVDIPAPPEGQQFNPRRVKVTSASGAVENALNYDPSCQAASSWHYDNPTSPKEIRLCPAACEAIRLDTEARLSVEFACEDVIFNI